jgi:hypothetical protein
VKLKNAILHQKNLLLENQKKSSQVKFSFKEFILRFILCRKKGNFINSSCSGDINFLFRSLLHTTFSFSAATWRILRNFSCVNYCGSSLKFIWFVKFKFSFQLNFWVDFIFVKFFGNLFEIFLIIFSYFSLNNFWIFKHVPL